MNNGTAELEQEGRCDFDKEMFIEAKNDNDQNSAPNTFHYENNNVYVSRFIFTMKHLQKNILTSRTAANHNTGKI